MASFSTQIKTPALTLLTREMDSHGNEILNSRRTVPDDEFYDIFMADPVPRLKGVVHMRLKAVLRIKYGGNAAGIYWGMYQVGVYNDLAKKAYKPFVKGARSLARQKLNLGLLPESARGRIRLLEAKQPDISAVLAVAVPNPRSRCWAKLNEAVAQNPKCEGPVALIETTDGISRQETKTAVQVTSLSELHTLLEKR